MFKDFLLRLNIARTLVSLSTTNFPVRSVCFQNRLGLYMNQCGKIFLELKQMCTDTVDGRNLAPVDIGCVPRYLHGFTHPRWCRISSMNSSDQFC